MAHQDFLTKSGKLTNYQQSGSYQQPNISQPSSYQQPNSCAQPSSYQQLNSCPQPSSYQHPGSGSSCHSSNPSSSRPSSSGGSRKDGRLSTAADAAAVAAAADGSLLNVSAVQEQKQLVQVKSEDAELPLVFKCLTCDTIFGDSMSWVRDDQKMKTFTLSRATRKVQVGTQFFHSDEGFDIGCSYVPLKCANCKVDIGKMYKATSRALDELRDLFTYDVDKIDTYEIGRIDQYQGNGDPIASRGLSSIRSSHAKLILSEIRKIQATILGLNERLTVVEKNVLSVGDGPDVQRTPSRETAKENDRISSGEALNGASAPKRGKLF